MSQQDNPNFDFELGKYKGRGRIGLAALGIVIFGRLIAVVTSVWLLKTATTVSLAY